MGRESVLNRQVRKEREENFLELCVLRALGGSFLIFAAFFAPLLEKAQLPRHSPAPRPGQVCGDM
jgi:hypothetical protein